MTSMLDSTLVTLLLPSTCGTHSAPNPAGPPRRRHRNPNRTDAQMPGPATCRVAVTRPVSLAAGVVRVRGLGLAAVRGRVRGRHVGRLVLAIRAVVVRARGRTGRSIRGGVRGRVRGR